jgi:hypothetical protein
VLSASNSQLPVSLNIGYNEQEGVEFAETCYNSSDGISTTLLLRTPLRHHHKCGQQRPAATSSTTRHGLNWPSSWAAQLLGGKQHHTRLCWTAIKRWPAQTQQHCATANRMGALCRGLALGAMAMEVLGGPLAGGRRQAAAPASLRPCASRACKQHHAALPPAHTERGPHYLSPFGIVAAGGSTRNHDTDSQCGHSLGTRPHTAAPQTRDRARCTSQRILGTQSSSLAVQVGWLTTNLKWLR